jgi:predicted dehydrogenase
MSEEKPARIRLGMVGGGKDAFIGGVHRIAARIDDQFELVAGALSASPEKARESGRALGLAEDRTYDDFATMAKREARRKNGIEAVAIVTPNHMHAPAAREFLKRGIHVICDKPLTATLPEAKKLAKLAAESDALFILTHNYTGYPMVRQARAMVADGTIGALRVVQVEYAQDWLATPVEASGQKQAGWRTDPARSGKGGSTGDIGTHAFNLASFVTGLKLEALAADLQAFVPGRRVDDNGHVMLRFEGGARGMLWCSQVATGSENALRLRVYGEKGGLEWAQEDPNYLWYTPLGEAKRLLTRGGAGAGPAAARVSRTPSGHPEGYLEGFANIYAEAARAILARRAGEPVPADVLYPTIDDGVAGVAFVDACVRSSERDAAWVRL